MSWLSPALLKSTLNSLENVLEKVDSTAATTLGKGENREINVNYASEEPSSSDYPNNVVPKQSPLHSPKQKSSTKLVEQDIFQFLNTPIQEQRTKRQATRKSSKVSQISISPPSQLNEILPSDQAQTDVTQITGSEPESQQTVEPSVSMLEEQKPANTETAEQQIIPEDNTPSTEEDIQSTAPATEQMQATSVEQPPNEPEDKFQEVLDQNADLLLENKLLRDEIVSLNQELVSLAARLKQAQQELENAVSKYQESHKMMTEKEKIISKMRRTEEELHNAISSKTSQLHTVNVKLEEALQEIKLKDNKIETFNQKISKLSDEKSQSVEGYRQNIDVLNTKLHEVEKELQSREQLVVELKQNLQQREGTWQASLNELSNAVAANQRIVEEKNAEIIRYQNQLKEHIDNSKNLRQELQEYKSRATKVLQEKEKVIKELTERLSSTVDANSPTNMTSNTVNTDPEKESLKSQLERTLQDLQESKQTIAELEQQHTEHTTKTEKQIHDTEAQLSRETKRVQNLQLELIHKSQELNSLRDQITSLTEQLALSVRQKEEEIQKLKKQIASKSASITQEELENRLQTVTEHLIQKQNQLEAVTSEKAYLQMQLEIAVQHQQKYKERDLLADVVDDEAPPMLSSGTPSKYGRRHTSSDHGMRLRPMSSLVENSSLMTQHPENAIARQVIGAANFLDSVSGFLINGVRRSPLLRLGTLCYLMLLHLYFFWIFYAWEPEIHPQK